jgi:two-component system CheB/CheR fusion protein
VRIRPYRTARNIVEGAVVTFIDITDAKRNERLQASRDLAESIVDAVREPFLVLDDGLRIVRANHAYYRAFRAEPGETEGRPIGDLGSRQWNLPALHARLEKVLQEGTGFVDLEVETELPQLGRRKLHLNARALTPKRGIVAEFVLLGIQEITGSQADASTPEGEIP